MRGIAAPKPALPTPWILDSTGPTLTGGAFFHGRAALARRAGQNLLDRRCRSYSRAVPIIALGGPALHSAPPSPAGPFLRGRRGRNRARILCSEDAERDAVYACSMKPAEGGARRPAGMWIHGPSSAGLGAQLA